MSDFLLWFKIGAEHIADIKAYDHIIFLLALIIPYDLKHWKQLLFLITAFTIGHSITLALSTLNFIQFSTLWIEFLIPVTILLTCIQNLITLEHPIESIKKRHYFLVLFFGLIHGLGFSILLRSLLGSEESIIGSLFAFNAGLETGQVAIFIVISLFSLLLRRIFEVNPSKLRFFVTSAVFGISFIMAIERLADLIH